VSTRLQVENRRKTGKAIRERHPDGTFEDVPRRLGREGPVVLAEVGHKPTEDEEAKEEKYADLTKI
jgi:hypothetical protein